MSLLSDLEKLERLSLVSKVCTELENHLGLNDKDTAEFIIHLAEKNDTFDKFKKVLVETSGESFPVGTFSFVYFVTSLNLLNECCLFVQDSFIENLLRIIQRMNPAMKQKQTKPDASEATLAGPMSGNNFKTVDSSVKKLLCPALGRADQAIKLDSDEEKPQVQTKELEASSSKKSKKKHRSRSRSRSRSPGHRKQRRHRSRSRSTSVDNRNRRRSRSRDNRGRRQSDYSSREEPVSEKTTAIIMKYILIE